MTEEVAAAAKPREIDSRVIVFKAAGGGDITSNARELEDDYVAFYENGAEHSLIRPPYDPKTLEKLVEQNNTLAPCIDVMVTNVDGTGYEILRRDGKKMEDSDNTAVEPAKNFFDECCPMMSFKTLREKIRREMESIGTGYIEVIRNAADEVVFAGHLESKMMRLGKLDPSVQVETTMMRGGKEVTFTRWVRERRYAQKVGENLVWFKEYGASRDLNSKTGQWAPKGTLPADLRATEVIRFGIVPDITTPYYVPRWISQTPSVIGSRKAEEHNNEFFDAGGIPPYLIIVEGGQLAEKAVEAIRAALNEKGAHTRAQVIEAFSTAGTLEQAAKVTVKVERFGAERTQDAMFMEFDKSCEVKVRRSFRIPPILIGQSDDYNFASAQAAYLVAEAQVFKPERESFDEVVSNTLMPELLAGSRDYVYRSKGISIIDSATQLLVVQAAASTSRVDPENLVDHLGEIGGMEFQKIDVSKVQQSPKDFVQDPQGNVVPLHTVRPPAPKPVAKGEADEVARLNSLIGCALAVMTDQVEFLPLELEEA